MRWEEFKKGVKIIVCYRGDFFCDTIGFVGKWTIQFEKLSWLNIKGCVKVGVDFIGEGRRGMEIFSNQQVGNFSKD